MRRFTCTPPLRLHGLVTNYVQDSFIRFEVFTAVTMKNGVFWYVGC
jgi:hypothetical protein